MTSITADMKNIVSADTVGSCQNLFLCWSKNLIVDFSGNALSQQILQAEIYPGYMSFRNHPTSQLRQIIADNIKGRLDSFLILSHQASQIRLSILQIWLHEFDNSTRAEQIVESSNLISIFISQLLSISHLIGKPLIILWQWLKMLQILTGLGCQKAFAGIREEAVSHNLDKIRLAFLNILNLSSQYLLCQLWLFKGIGVYLIS